MKITEDLFEEVAQLTKTLPCGKCGTPVGPVSDKTVFVLCKACSSAKG